MDLLGLAPLLPEGLVLAGIRAPLAAGPGFAWYPLASDISFTPEAVARTADLVESVIDADIRPADFRTVSLLGFSQGMSIGSVLAQRARWPYSALVGLSGFWIDQPGTEPVSIPVFYGRGLADPVFTPERVEATLQELAPLESVTLKTYPGLPHSISQDEMQDVQAFLTAALQR